MSDYSEHLLTHLSELCVGECDGEHLLSSPDITEDETDLAFATVSDARVIRRAYILDGAPVAVLCQITEDGLQPLALVLTLPLIEGLRLVNGEGRAPERVD